MRAQRLDKTLAITGLWFTFFGAALLFKFGMPKKEITPKVIVYGELALNHEPGESGEWQALANKAIRRHKFWNRAGFGLVASGTLLQIVALYCAG
jgi:hypothetical protein